MAQSWRVKGCSAPSRPRNSPADDPGRTTPACPPPGAGHLGLRVERHARPSSRRPSTALDGVFLHVVDPDAGRIGAVHEEVQCQSCALELVSQVRGMDQHELPIA